MQKVWRLIGILPLIMLAMVACEYAVAGYRTGVAYGFIDPVRLAQYRLYTADTGRFVTEIEQAIDNQDYAYAEELYDLGLRYGHDLPPDLKERAQANFARRAYASGSRALRGFVFGSVDSGEEIAGSVTSDLVGVGDLRDFSVQGYNYMAGNDYDPLLLGLATVGLGLSAATYGSVGMTAAPDAGLSMFKNAYRARKLSRPLTAYLAKSTEKLVDTGVLKAELKSAAGEGLSGIGRMRQAAAKSVDRQAAKSLMNDAEVLGDIGKTGGAKGAMAALALADGPKDLRKLQRVSKAFGGESHAVLKFLGRAVLRIGYGLYAVLAGLASLALWLSIAVIRIPLRIGGRLLVRRLGLGEGAVAAIRPLMRLW
ncbi:MAG: hypothetical protein ACOH2J_18820 [Allorhizobium sp.]